MTKIVAFVNQKGGVGKSTLTSVVANYLHFEKNQEMNTIVIDADPQKTLTKLRASDLDEKGIDNERLYKLINIEANSIKDNLEMLAGYDVVFLDLPGTVMQKGIVEAYSLIDLILIPTALSRADIDSTMEFYEIIKDKIMPLREEYGLISGNIWGVLNRVKTNTIEYKEFLQAKDELPFKFLETCIQESHVTFQREASTYIPYNEEKTESFCKEVLSKIIGE